MIYNNLWGLWCELCKGYKDPYTEVYLPDGEEGRVSCLKCDNVLGFTWDNVWQQLFGVKDDLL